MLALDGSRTLTQMAEGLELTTRRVTTLVDALAGLGLVERRAHPADRRAALVTITPAGREQQAACWRQYQDTAAAAFADLPAADRALLACIADEVTASIRTRLASHPPAPGR
jgi:DNA-binding MarR family transcriptional regulator